MDSSPQFVPELAVVMPIYNEAANIATVIREWFPALDKIAPDFVLFAINDGSTDETASILGGLRREFGPRLVVANKENSGHGASCRAGYERALGAGCAWILQIDSDGQCDPKFFAQFYASRGSFDCGFGYRQTRCDGLGRLVVSRMSRALLWVVSGTPVKDPNVPYRLIRAKALRRALRSIPADLELQNIALSIVLGREPTLRWKHFAINFRSRQGGENSINYRKIARMGIEFLSDLHRITDEDSDTWWRPRWARRRVAS